MSLSVIAIRSGNGAADEQRSLMVAEPTGGETREVPVVVNWFPELESLLPPPH